jgi:ABC-2 type transport system ATP-binding protein
MPEWMTVTRFLNFVRPLYPQWDRALEASLLQRFDLPLKRLSRGMRMKAAFVSSLAYRPSLLVLDPLVRDQLVQVLRLLAREGMTILLSSHDLAEIEDFATHLGFLEKGTLLFAESIPDLKARFREVSIPYQSALPASILSSWWQPEIRDGSLRFVVADNAPEEIAAIHQHFPTPLIPRIEPMTLRAIFIALAQSKSQLRRCPVPVFSRRERHAKRLPTWKTVAIHAHKTPERVKAQE